MVRTRSQNSQHEAEQDEHIAPQEPIPRAPNPARPVQIRFMDPSTSTGFGSLSADRARPPSPTRSTRSQRSTASTTARIKQAEYNAAEQLAAIQMRQLQIEADLIQKKLEADIATLQDDEQGSTCGPEEASNTNLQMEDWLRNTDPTRGEQVYENLPARVTRTTPFATPAKPVPNPTERDYEDRRTHSPTQNLPARETRTPLAATPVKPVPNTTERRYDDRRTRSPTPNRSRNRSVEALAECFERMSQYRPPPRSSTELPTFNGNENEWLPFKASMRDSTRLHKFSPIENLQRLRNALKGEARDAVASLLYTACDPAEIMEALEQSFGRPEALIDKALDEIKLLPPLGPTATELNVFAVKVRNIVATITNVEGLDGCLQNRMLTRDIVDKLPPDMRRSFARYASENRRPREPHIVILSRFLNYEATIGLEFTYSKPSTPALHQNEPTRSTRTASQITRKNHEANIYTAREEQCMCCGGNHEPPQCKKIQDMTVNVRWEWAKEQKICFKCLKNRHLRTECKSKRCDIDGCIHSHHTLLHEHRPASDTSNTNPDESKEHAKEVVASTSSSTKTGGRHKPSRTELGWVLHSTSPRATMMNQEEHVFHLRTENLIQPARNEHLDYSVSTFKTNKNGVSFKPKVNDPNKKDRPRSSLS